jgi:riboflavin kinase/FMN adenylyltransferase
MRRVLGLEDLAPGSFRRPVAALGVFDGVHLGHRAVLAETAALAAEAGGEPVAVTFDIHPRVVVEGKGPGLLTSLPHRLRLLEAAGAAGAVVLRFDEALRARSAEWFLEEFLVGRMGIAGLVLGPDSHFGKDRRGNPAMARALLEPRGVRVRDLGRVQGRLGPVSSTAIRAAVRAGDLEAAASMLGRPVTVLGTVVRGDGRGRGLGTPTANLDCTPEIHPPRGVYVGSAVLPGAGERHALVNVGARPTFKGEGAGGDVVEAWFPGWEGDLYGKELELAFLARLRDERKFPGPEALREQIRRDREALEDWIRRGPAPAFPQNGGALQGAPRDGP